MARSLSRSIARRARLLAWVALGLAGLASTGLARQVPPDPNLPVSNGPEPEVLARGPVHEAYAGPIVANPSPGAVVPKPPPTTQIEEVPPGLKPQGTDVEWIPGYWAWDDDRADYLWVSGVWRDIPPGRQWIPGYWGQVADGYVWTPGFWAASSANGQFDYLPAPPESLEAGPNAPQPGPDYSWVPGSWAWTQDRYAWRPGYWIQANPDWVWTPSTYVPTPSGYVYNEGFWDYNLERRGVAFAPVAFGAATYARPTYAYSPTSVLPVAGLLTSLFVRPNHYGHYYFGDYYGAANAPRAGYVPWFGLQQQRLGYDPLYASLSARNARQPEWDRRIREDYRERLEYRQARPAPTFAAQRDLVDQRRARGEDVRHLDLVRPLHQWSATPEAGVHRFAPVSEALRVDQSRRLAEVQAVRQERARMETHFRPPADARPEQAQPRRMELPRSPIVAGASAHPGPRPGGFVPPPHPEAHRATVPNFPHPPAVIRPENVPGHREPRPGPPHPESRPGGPPHAAHAEPRPAPKPDHPKPGKPR